MGLTLAEKIINEHIVEGEPVKGSQIGLKIDQTLTQDATGTMAYLQFEAMGLDRVKTELSVSYVDHNMLQTDFRNADDHAYLKSVAQKYGIYFSKPGNGICHQVHRERFGIPGKTLLGSDSHTPTGGGLGMISIGAGGLDVAVAMGGGPFFLTYPQILGIKLTGELKPYVNAKNVIFKLLEILTVKGGVGKVLEYFGPGVKALSAGDRFAISNMGTEVGATTSIFPSDENTKLFLDAQGRGESWVELSADDDAEYDEIIEIDLSSLEPLVAEPGSPDNIVDIKSLVGKKVSQVLIGTCTNSSYEDMMTVAKMLEGKKVNNDVDFGVAPGSKQVFQMIAESGGLGSIISSGARILESACGFCIGMGQAPPTDGISLRTGNRNFPGRSGTQGDNIYLVSPEIATASALAGEFVDPTTLSETIRIEAPSEYKIDDSGIIPPSENPSEIKIIRGPNIKAVPVKEPLADSLKGEVIIKVGDNITTDHIMPAGAKVLPFRSNIPAISEFVYVNVDDTFAKRAKESPGGMIVGGTNYGQGSSREHAALAPMFLGINAIIVNSFARIHRANLINFGILPLLLDAADNDKIEQGDELEIGDIYSNLDSGSDFTIKNNTKGIEFTARCDLSELERKILVAGGKLPYTKSLNLN
ncbi:MAG: aconitate hydratase [Candidatus Marinimicrobia bacterium]|nr:aconitate hydratase [Candidatus Neomarinimicrobiota bacterium]